MATEIKALFSPSINLSILSSIAPHVSVSVSYQEIAMIAKTIFPGDIDDLDKIVKWDSFSSKHLKGVVFDRNILDTIDLVSELVRSEIDKDNTNKIGVSTHAEFMFDKGEITEAGVKTYSDLERVSFENISISLAAIRNYSKYQNDDVAATLTAKYVSEKGISGSIGLPFSLNIVHDRPVSSKTGISDKGITEYIKPHNDSLGLTVDTKSFVDESSNDFLKTPDSLDLDIADVESFFYDKPLSSAFGLSSDRVDTFLNFSKTYKAVLASVDAKLLDKYVFDRVSAKLKFNHESDSSANDYLNAPDSLDFDMSDAESFVNEKVTNDVELFFDRNHFDIDSNFGSLSKIISNETIAFYMTHIDRFGVLDEARKETGQVANDYLDPQDALDFDMSDESCFMTNKFPVDDINITESQSTNREHYKFSDFVTSDERASIFEKQVHSRVQFFISQLKELPEMPNDLVSLPDDVSSSVIDTNNFSVDSAYENIMSMCDAYVSELDKGVYSGAPVDDTLGSEFNKYVFTQIAIKSSYKSVVDQNANDFINTPDSLDFDIDDTTSSDSSKVFELSQSILDRDSVEYDSTRHSSASLDNDLYRYIVSHYSSNAVSKEIASSILNKKLSDKPSIEDVMSYVKTRVNLLSLNDVVNALNTSEIYSDLFESSFSETDKVIDDKDHQRFSHHKHNFSTSNLPEYINTHHSMSAVIDQFVHDWVNTPDEVALSIDGDLGISTDRFLESVGSVKDAIAYVKISTIIVDWLKSKADIGDKDAYKCFESRSGEYNKISFESIDYRVLEKGLVTNLRFKHEKGSRVVNYKFTSLYEIADELMKSANTGGDDRVSSLVEFDYIKFKMYLLEIKDEISTLEKELYEFESSNIDASLSVSSGVDFKERVLYYLESAKRIGIIPNDDVGSVFDRIENDVKTGLSDESSKSWQSLAIEAISSIISDTEILEFSGALIDSTLIEGMGDYLDFPYSVTDESMASANPAAIDAQIISDSLDGIINEKGLHQPIISSHLIGSYRTNHYFVQGVAVDSTYPETEKLKTEWVSLNDEFSHRKERHRTYSDESSLTYGDMFNISANPSSIDKIGFSEFSGSLYKEKGLAEHLNTTHFKHHYSTQHKSIYPYIGDSLHPETIKLGVEHITNSIEMWFVKFRIRSFNFESSFTYSDGYTYEHGKGEDSPINTKHNKHIWRTAHLFQNISPKHSKGAFTTEHQYGRVGIQSGKLYPLTIKPSFEEISFGDSYEHIKFRYRNKYATDPVWMADNYTVVFNVGASENLTFHHEQERYATIGKSTSAMAYEFGKVYDKRFTDRPRFDSLVGNSSYSNHSTRFGSSHEMDYYIIKCPFFRLYPRISSKYKSCYQEHTKRMPMSIASFAGKESTEFAFNWSKLESKNASAPSKFRKIKLKVSSEIVEIFKIRVHQKIFETGFGLQDSSQYEASCSIKERALQKDFPMAWPLIADSGVTIRPDPMWLKSNDGLWEVDATKKAKTLSSLGIGSEFPKSLLVKGSDELLEEKLSRVDDEDFDSLSGSNEVFAEVYTKSRGKVETVNVGSINSSPICSIPIDGSIEKEVLIDYGVKNNSVLGSRTLNSGAMNSDDISLFAKSNSDPKSDEEIMVLKSTFQLS